MNLNSNHNSRKNLKNTQYSKNSRGIIAYNDNDRYIPDTSKVVFTSKVKKIVFDGFYCHELTTSRRRIDDPSSILPNNSVFRVIYDSCNVLFISQCYSISFNSRNVNNVTILDCQYVDLSYVYNMYNSAEYYLAFPGYVMISNVNLSSVYGNSSKVNNQLDNSNKERIVSQFSFQCSMLMFFPYLIIDIGGGHGELNDLFDLSFNEKGFTNYILFEPVDVSYTSVSNEFKSLINGINRDFVIIMRNSLHHFNDSRFLQLYLNCGARAYLITDYVTEGSALLCNSYHVKYPEYYYMPSINMITDVCSSRLVIAKFNDFGPSNFIFSDFGVIHDIDINDDLDNIEICIGVYAKKGLLNDNWLSSDSVSDDQEGEYEVIPIKVSGIDNNSVKHDQEVERNVIPIKANIIDNRFDWAEADYDIPYDKDPEIEELIDSIDNVIKGSKPDVKKVKRIDEINDINDIVIEQLMGENVDANYIKFLDICSLKDDILVQEFYTMIGDSDVRINEFIEFCLNYDLSGLKPLTRVNYNNSNPLACFFGLDDDFDFNSYIKKLSMPLIGIMEYLNPRRFTNARYNGSKDTFLVVFCAYVKNYVSKVSLDNDYAFYVIYYSSQFLSRCPLPNVVAMADYILKDYKQPVVCIDPFAGYGDRLLSIVLHSLYYPNCVYVGFDIDKDQITGLNLIAGWVNKYGIKIVIKLYNCSFKASYIKEFKNFDFMYTCPPFFTSELINKIDQDYHVWIETVFYPLLNAIKSNENVWKRAYFYVNDFIIGRDFYNMLDDLFNIFGGQKNMFNFDILGRNSSIHLLLYKSMSNTAINMSKFAVPFLVKDKLISTTQSIQDNMNIYHSTFEMNVEGNKYTPTLHYSGVDINQRVRPGFCAHNKLINSNYTQFRYKSGQIKLAILTLDLIDLYTPTILLYLGAGGHNSYLTRDLIDKIATSQKYDYITKIVLVDDPLFDVVNNKIVRIESWLTDITYNDILHAINHNVNDRVLIFSDIRIDNEGEQDYRLNMRALQTDDENTLIRKLHLDIAKICFVKSALKYNYCKGKINVWDGILIHQYFNVGEWRIVTDFHSCKEVEMPSYSEEIERETITNMFDRKFLKELCNSCYKFSRMIEFLNS